MQHLQRQLSSNPPARENETVDTSYIAVCGASSSGMSCSKILLHVFLKEKPDFVRCTYAIIDEQSNSSVISSELADELDVSGPQEKYYLSTCTSEKEVKYGCHIANVSIRSKRGVAYDLPTLVECKSKPQDKQEIPHPRWQAGFHTYRDCR